MFRVSFIFLLGLVLFACSGEPSVKKPDDLLSQEQMVEVLYEMGLTEAAYHGRTREDTLALEKFKQRIVFNYEELGITREQFESSYDYYMHQPEELVKIYNEVLARYSTRISEVEEEID
ncbi:MAG: hypothetical protein CL840_10290 [Crocinitomicaceae bacterium]|nr:hypothetical protein [Crocinitomicaceae bacterium]|tara:strand:- start:12652 stop:13008 length:357 start_codon:yes stop_codon:yes gene_type:complete